MITLSIILSLLVFLLGYTSYNLFKKVEKLERVVDSQDTYVRQFSKAIDYTSKRLETIDAKGTFESDDEIGWFFESVKTLQRELNEFNINENNRSQQPNNNRR
jgi:uncharacterized membrane protein YukC